MAIPECAFTSRLSDFVQESDLREFRDRVTACSSYGSRLMCCEKNTDSSTTRTTITQQETTNRIQTSQGDPLTHPNHRFFKNLKCGLSLGDRIANGEQKKLRSGYRLST